LELEPPFSASLDIVVNVVASGTLSVLHTLFAGTGLKEARTLTQNQAVKHVSLLSASILAPEYDLHIACHTKYRKFILDRGAASDPAVV